MKQVTVIGCGIVGAMIAYELSGVEGIAVTVLDRQRPGTGATQAALGVLMGAISHKTQGRAWQLRRDSLDRFETLIDELEALTGQRIPFNRQGILHLCFVEDDLDRWQHLIQTRSTQGWPLVWLDRPTLAQRYPQVQDPSVVGAVYSARDRQVNPLVLTQTLVAAAQMRGAKFYFEADVDGFLTTLGDDAAIGTRHCSQVCWAQEAAPTDYVVVTAGLGSKQVTARLQTPLEVRPVLGQALQVRLQDPLGNVAQQPVITGKDIHIVPILKPWGTLEEQALYSQAADYWIGATVELPDADGTPATARAAALDSVWQGAITFCPALAKGEIVRTWSGFRPRPEGRSAPILEPLMGYDNVLLATGHYRNGVLLAPATAQWVKQQIK